MSKKIRNTMILIIAIVCLLIMANLVMSNISNNDIKNKNSIKFASPNSYDIYDQFLDMGVDAYGSWEFETIDGYTWDINNDTYYIGLDTDSATRYSLTLSMVSPIFYLNNLENEFVFSMDYFSGRVDEEYAGKIEILGTSNGNDFYLLDTINRVYDNNEGNYNSFSLDIDNNISQIKIRAKVLYNCGENSGISLKNIKVMPKVVSDLEVPSFVNIFETTDFVANGTIQVPSYKTFCGNNDYNFNVITKIYKDNVLSESIDKGNYEMYLFVFSQNSKIVDIEKKEYEIAPVSINNIKVDYYANDTACLIREIRVFDKDNNDITDLVGEISYVINGTGNERFINVTIQESQNNELYIQSGIVAPNKNIEVVSMKSYQVYTYNGQNIDIDYVNTSDSTITFDYTNENNELYQNETPKDAGVYNLVMKSNENEVATATIKILPKEITQITYNKPIMEKYFDGSYKLNNFDIEDFTFTGIVPEDTISLSGLYVDRLEGIANVIDDEIYLGNNYIYNPSVAFEKNCAIKLSNLTLINNLDENLLGEDKHILRAKTKEYDGTTIAETDIDRVKNSYEDLEKVPLIFAGNDPSDTIFADRINMEYLDFYAGIDKELKISFVDPILADRYNSEIITNSPDSKVVGEIAPKEITVDTTNSDIVISDKVYDQTNNVDISINSLVFTGILQADTLDNYIIECQNCEFSDSNVGMDKNVLISGIQLKPINKQNEKLLASYVVKDITEGLQADITKKEVEIIDASYNIISGEEVPTARTNPSDVILDFRYFATTDDAIMESNELLDFDTNTTGTYYIRAEVNSSQVNYKMEYGYVVLILNIAEEKHNQTIISGIEEVYSYHSSEGDYYKMAIGGKYCIDAYSTTNGYKNNLEVTTEIEQTSSILTRDATTNIFTARNAGEATILLKQDGDDEYNSAQTIRIKIIVEDVDLESYGLSGNDNVYYGQKLPDISGGVMFGSESVSGSFINNGQYPEVGENMYYYTFITNQKYLGYYEVLVEIITEKATILIELSDIEKEYYSDINFNDYATISLKKGTEIEKLSTNEVEDLGIIYNYNVEYKDYDCGNYTIKLRGNEGDTDILTLQEMENYDYEFTNTLDTINLSVVKSDITISLPIQNKFYGQEVKSIDNIKKEILISGNFNSENDREDLLNELDVIVQLDNYDKVGSYVINFNIEDNSLFVNKYNIGLESSVYYVNATPVKVIANDIGHFYGGELVDLSYRFEGFFIDEDKQEILKDITATCDVAMDSIVGEYAIILQYLGNNPCYEVTVQDGLYIVRAARLTGFSLEGEEILYDAKPHSLQVEYDEDLWQEIGISYNIENLVDPGEYEIVAQINKENYETLIISAILKIKSKEISTTNRVNDGTIILPSNATEGFDPDATLRFEKNNQTDINNDYNSILVSTDTSEEEIFGVYDFYAFANESKIEIPSNTYLLKFKVDGINSSEGIRILALNEQNEPVEIAYTYAESYFMIEVNNFEQIAIVNTASKMVQDTKSLIMAIVLAIILLWIFFAILYRGIKKAKKKEARSIKKHKKWA